MKKKDLIILIVLLVIVLVFLSGYYYWGYKNNKNVINFDDDEIISDVFDKRNTNYNSKIIDEYVKLYNNSDVVGEISIINSDFKKAIMQGNDNDYYLNHTEDKTNSYMGSIYLDFRINIDDGKKLLIYGHNSGNIVMPFQILEEYYDYEFYQGHKYIKIITSNKTRLYKIYSVFVEVEDFGYMQTDFNNEDEWYEHINNFKKKSMYDTLEDVKKEDNILILQTCSTYYKYRDYQKKFLLVVAKEVSEK